LAILVGIAAALYFLYRKVTAGISTATEIPAQWFVDLTSPARVENVGAVVLPNGQTLTVDAIYNLHNVGKPYTMKNYKAVLLKMEQENAIQTDPPSTKRRKGTIGDNVKVTFPPDKNKRGSA